ncbi:hypothetical protein HNQ08_004375 [Deinococcus humi]|uniref:Uncharacterized protein n=1 Tax=Deinococcus humi TaxID=662880 RepID=A0A7W8JY25_9DEIO|nr:hypothetical protein [Deinococcus humi]
MMRVRGVAPGLPPLTGVSSSPPPAAANRIASAGIPGGVIHDDGTGPESGQEALATKDVPKIRVVAQAQGDQV